MPSIIILNRIMSMGFISSLIILNDAFNGVPIGLNGPWVLLFLVMYGLTQLIAFVGLSLETFSFIFWKKALGLIIVTILFISYYYIVSGKVDVLIEIGIKEVIIWLCIAKVIFFCVSELKEKTG